LQVEERDLNVMRRKTPRRCRVKPEALPVTTAKNQAASEQRCPDIPVTMVTAYGDDEQRRRASEYGASEFLSKPVDFC
jgi:CheY-like chemotaxis protein